MLNSFISHLIPSSIFARLLSVLCLLSSAFCLLASGSAASDQIMQPSRVGHVFPDGLVGKQDSLLLAAPDGRILASVNPHAPRIPASTLKILTSLLALRHLGPDYRFTTSFFLDNRKNLLVRGAGDPLLTSEIIDDMARGLAEKIDSFGDLVCDDTFFEKPLLIPGVAPSSLQPYDAPNGALSVNFNSVGFKRKGKTILSAEPRTPLLPAVVDRIKASGLSSGRIPLSPEDGETTRYAGHMIRDFLRKIGIRTTGAVRPGKVAGDARAVLRHVSPYTLEPILSRLLEHSSNFMANQLLLTAGAEVYGPPATLEKGVRLAETYLRSEMDTTGLCVVEGSGISRDNRISATQLNRLLEIFEPHHRLMRKGVAEYYKTGTLTGIQTRAGYLESGSGELYRYVVMLNSGEKSMDRIMKALRVLVSPP
jgi:D-alanyl-D-alanine carboxypeptidase/D-alanyl-D-alanine-endopeptidase (penicillin-binding protein 4)